MALTPDAGGWIFLSVCRLFVGAGVSGLFAVDLPLVQEFVPSRKRGWVGGIVTCCLPLGGTLAALLGAYLEPYVGWRGSARKPRATGLVCGRRPCLCCC